MRAAKQLTQWPLWEAPRGALLWFADTLEWLQFWQPAAGDELTADPAGERPNNHLSPRL